MNRGESRKRGAGVRRVLTFLLAACLVLLGSTGAARAGVPLVLAPASLQESMTEAADAWAAHGHERPIISFAATSALARQIRAGAPADLFVSADEAWMDEVERGGLLRPGTRSAFLGNRLVLIAPRGSAVRLRIAPGMRLAQALNGGRLAMADPDAVPAGRYGSGALEHLGVWASVSGHVARGESVRAALALVERRTAPLGIVYETDARASGEVEVVGRFPADSHSPITYELAELRAAPSAGAAAFRRFLLSREGRSIFARYGFSAR
jgi:molybdate transport system substrate-binding protein